MSNEADHTTSPLFYPIITSYVHQIRTTGHGARRGFHTSLGCLIGGSSHVTRRAAPAPSGAYPTPTPHRAVGRVVLSQARKQSRRQGTRADPPPRPRRYLGGQSSAIWRLHRVRRVGART